MVTKRRVSFNSGASSSRQGRPLPTSKAKKRVHKAYQKGSIRTRTSLVGMTIYQPDIKPSPQGRKLLEALEG
jgi:hypothetical protein